MESTNIKQVVETADLLNRTLRKLIISDQGIHAETIIAASSRMAGTMLLHAVAPEVRDLEPGSGVLSDPVERQGPALMQTTLATLRQLGHDEIDEQRVGGEAASTAMSRLSLAETQEILEPWYRKIAEVSGLSLRDIAASAAMTTALLIHDCRAVLEIHAACAIALHGLVESTKTVPARVAIDG